MSPRSHELGPLEMDILGRLSGEEAHSVSSVQAQLKRAGHDLAYTTVMTVLSRLHAKGLVRRDKEGRQFLYRACSTTERTGEKLLQRMGKALFRNKRIAPILSLLEGESELTTEELRELRKAVDEKLRQSETSRKPR